jgi:hypothetical protein
MLYLLVALLLAVALQLPAGGQVPLLRGIWPTYLHLLVVGWLTQLIFGVAVWLRSTPHNRPAEAIGSAGLRLSCSTSG